MTGRRDYWAEAKAEFESLAPAAGPGPRVARQSACDFPKVPFSPINTEQRTKAEFDALLADLGDLEGETGD